MRYTVPYPPGSRLLLVLCEVLVSDKHEPDSAEEYKEAMDAFEAGECCVNCTIDGKEYFQPFDRHKPLFTPKK